MRKQEPIKVEDLNDSWRDGKRLTHPAFGLVSVSEITGRSVMFGSEIIHDRVVRVRVSHAHQDRSLSNDWNHERGSILEFDMTHGQFAQMIASHSGRSTPVTLRMHRVGELHTVPEIEKESVAPKIEVFKSEMAKSVSEIVSRSNEGFEGLESALKELKIPQKTRDNLLRMVNSAKGGLSNLPSSLTFILEQAHEAAEGVANDAKVSLEAYALQRLSDMAAGDCCAAPLPELNLVADLAGANETFLENS